MRLPLSVSDALNADLQARWTTDFASFTSRDRTVEEGIWRRTQEPANANESEWRSKLDARRRIVHYHYKFGLTLAGDETFLSLGSVYLYQSLTLPSHELKDFHERILTALVRGGWIEDGEGALSRGDLVCVLRRYAHHPEDTIPDRRLPADYESLDVSVESAKCALPDDRRRLPWDVLSRGVRRRDTRGEPTFIPNLAPLARFLPFQIELGCGISAEAGIPPLHFLHDLYSVTSRQTGAFIFGEESDTFLADVLADPETQLHRRGQMMQACLLATPTPAHHVLRELAARKMLLAPVITNNFDGLHARVGLDECYIRRYDEDVPDVPIYPETKALLIVGSHADRRKVQARFRERGLPIFFLDPEGFHENGRFIPYLIEGARQGDYVCHAGAAAGLLQLAQELDLHVEC